MRTFFAIAVFLLIAGTKGSAQVPQLINYQGRVVVGGTNFSGTGAFKVSMVSGTSGATFWSNDGTGMNGSEPAAAVSVSVSNGLYSLLLGDTSLLHMTAIPASVFGNSDVRLRIWFNDGTHGSQLLSPDQRIGAVGYAMMAGNVPDGAITSSKIANGAIGTAQLAGGGVAYALTSGSAALAAVANGLTAAPGQNINITASGSGAIILSGSTIINNAPLSSNSFSAPEWIEMGFEGLSNDVLDGRMVVLTSTDGLNFYSLPGWVYGVTNSTLSNYVPPPLVPGSLDTFGNLSQPAFRNGSIARLNMPDGAWYVAPYTTGTSGPFPGHSSTYFAAADYWGMARSQDLLHWSFYTNVVTGTNYTNNWSPNIFLDDNGLVYCCIGCATGGPDNVTVRSYIQQATDSTLRNWTAPQEIVWTGISQPITHRYDHLIIKSGSTYHLFAGTGPYHGVSANVWGPYAPVPSGSFTDGTISVIDVGSFGGHVFATEALSVYPLANGTWIMRGEASGPLPFDPANGNPAKYGHRYFTSPDLYTWSGPYPMNDQNGPPRDAYSNGTNDVYAGSIIEIQPALLQNGKISTTPVNAATVSNVTPSVLGLSLLSATNLAALQNALGLTSSSAGVTYSIAPALATQYRQTLFAAGGPDIYANGQYNNIVNGLQILLQADGSLKDIGEIWLTRPEQNAGTGTTIYGLLGKHNATITGAATWTTGELDWAPGSSMNTFAYYFGASPIGMAFAGAVNTKLVLIGNDFGYRAWGINYAGVGNFGSIHSGANWVDAGFGIPADLSRFTAAWLQTSGTTANFYIKGNNGITTGQGSSQQSQNWDAITAAGTRMINNTFGATFHTSCLILTSGTLIDTSVLSNAIKSGFESDLSLP